MAADLSRAKEESEAGVIYLGKWTVFAISNL